MNNSPLAEILRPKTLKDFVGQSHIVGKNKLINNLLKADKLPSLIFWGPPGTGKTTLARIIANELDRDFFEFSAVNTSMKVIEEITRNKKQDTNQKLFPSPLIFLDEIHRLNKAQQDKLLPHVERGDIVLIGATTENPSFEVNNALLSRSRVVVLKQFEEADLKKIINKSLKYLNKKMELKAKKFLINACNGDARVLINAIEIASQLANTPPYPSSNLEEGTKGWSIKIEHIEQAMQKRAIGFDKNGDEHYNVISAFIKSMRASNMDAAIYYLARMIEAGQDPLYIARRMVIFASEDIGMAQPTALVVANEVFRACETIGYPECSINLAHGVAYLASAKKNRSAYDALRAAQADVAKYGNLEIPKKILNSPTDLMKDLGYGKGYEKYDKDKSSYLPEKLEGKQYFKK